MNTYSTELKLVSPNPGSTFKMSISHPCGRRREELQDRDGAGDADVGHEGGDAPQRHEAPHQVHRPAQPRRQPGENPGRGTWYTIGTCRDSYMWNLGVVADLDVNFGI